jgi:isoquinoline 1-oxidoreductase
MSRRTFVKWLGAGILISVTRETAVGEERGRDRGRDRGRGRGGDARQSIAARVHIGKDGTITVMTGKVEIGQGGRAEISQAAAEELRVPVERVQLVMADTELCPDDGPTSGSRTTPSTIPAVRRGCAAARDLLAELASKRWQVERSSVTVKDGTAAHEATKRALTYAEIASAEDLTAAFAQAIPQDVTLTPVAEWKVMGTSYPRPNLRDLVTGAHCFPSDTVRPGMLQGKVLRPPSFGAKLRSIDLTKAKAMEGVVVIRDGDFIGCAAPTTSRAAQALSALAETAAWDPAPHPSSKELFSHLKARVRGSAEPRGSVAEALRGAKKVLGATYTTAYIQHAPLEPRAAVAEWNDGKVTIWTGSQAPFGVRSEVARTLGIPEERVRVIIPDAGGGFGGKHTGEYAVEAARLAREAGRPMALRWTRREEFTWAYYRPAALIEIQAGLDDNGSLVAWNFVNINSGGAGVGTPYEVPMARTESLPSDPPLRQGSYRTLAATANNFARECFMDELAAAAGSDPLGFRLSHLKNDRLRAVLEAAARRFGWKESYSKREPGVGVGLSCGTEKGSVVAACAEVACDRAKGTIEVRRACQVFECGAIQNPANLLSQVQGCIIMGLGGALSEEIEFEGGKVLTDAFSKYPVPRFLDVPPLDIELLDRPDIPSAGGGETPIIAIAPAVANAVFHATGVRLRALPLRSALLKQA